MTSFSHSAWDGSAARFTPEQWKASTLIDTGEGAPDSKSRYKLPICEPSGAVNVNALHAAAAALAGGRTPLQAPPAEKKKAARKLKRLYLELKAPVPPVIQRMAM